MTQITDLCFRELDLCVATAAKTGRGGMRAVASG